MLDLETLQAVDAPADSRGEGLDVTGGTADERAELALGEGEESRVLLPLALGRKISGG